MAKPKKKPAPRPIVYAMLEERAYPILDWTHKPRLYPGQKAPLESKEGEIAHNVLDLKGILHTHVANEMLDKRILGAAQRQGMRTGWPDFWVSMGGGRAIFIELKRLRWAPWQVSTAQVQVIRDLRRDGFVAEIAWGSDHLLALVDFYRDQ